MVTARPTVCVLSLGGTIAMMPDREDDLARPRFDAADLVRSVPQLADVATITTEPVRRSPSAWLVVDDVLAALVSARRAVDDGAAGVVLTHGTDTLEETAYLLDLLWDRSEPLVVTGAMRSPNLPGADGPANLLAAAVTACAHDARGLGVVVVLADEVHLARAVTKSDAQSVATFRSPGWGPVGRVVEGRLRLALRPARTFAPLPDLPAGPVRVPLLEATLGDDGSTLRSVLVDGPPAVVLAGAGAGNVSVPLADVCSEAVAEGTAVVLASRTGSGPVLEHSYGYPGSATDLHDRGALSAGLLPGRKARLLTHVLVSAGADHEALRAQLSARGQ